jgi:alpha-glucosidase (family GH31 glycosyl hydrolase)
VCTSSYFTSYADLQDDELATRWVQLGCFSPILRLHSSNNPFNCREPWHHGAEAEKVQSNFLRLRHRLVPYTYTEAIRCSTEGRSLVEPIYYDYSHRSEAYKNKNQSTFGTQLIINPITSPRDKGTMMGRADTWLPSGLWVDLFTYVVYDGDRVTALHRTLESLPVLAKPGAIIPLESTKEVGNGCLVPEEMEAVVVVGADGEYELLEDDGSGAQVEEVKFSTTKITLDQSAGTITIHSSANHIVKQRKWSIRLPAFTNSSNITAKAGSDIDMTVNKKQYHTVIELPSLPTSSDIIISLPANPQLDETNDVLPRIQRLLNSMQIGHNPKLDIWNAVKTEGKPHVRLSRLEALGVDAQVESAVKEIMFARG